MKRKGVYLQGATLFKWHLIAVVGFAMLVAYKIIAEVTFPGNATVPFAVLRPDIIEKLSLVLIMGAIVVVHFLIYQSRTVLQARACQQHVHSLNLTGYEDAKARLEVSGELAEFDGEIIPAAKQKDAR